MAIVAMRHLRLIGLQSEREEMLRRLQHLGCLENTEPEPAADDPLLEKLRIRLRISPGLLPQAIRTALCHQQFLSTIRGGLLSYLIHFFFGP